MQALIARGVIGDFRAGDPASEADREHPALRLHAAVHPLRRRLGRASSTCAQVLDSGEWREPRFNQRAAVT